MTVLIAQSFVRNQGDGWGWTLDWLRRAMNEVESGRTEPVDAFAGYLGFAAAVGRRLAETHAALATPNDDPAFMPETVTSDDCARWSATAAADLNQVLDSMARRAEPENEETAALVRSLIERREPLIDAVQRLNLATGALLKTRVHGDFHLGQVLVAQGDAVLVDFEGEPARGLAERRAKTSPAKDIAGLLRSFDYAAEILSAETAAIDPSALARRHMALEDWRQSAATAFLEAYGLVSDAQPGPSLRMADVQGVIDIFLIEKVAYEIAYEIANRPEWLHIPLRGLERLARRLSP
jgi:maltose alpha-D-glucosyltransferase/alpha-amylase